ncbi:MAG: glycosyltransferase family 10 domain-containing protein [Phycisphaerales bacterium JB059]
MPRTVGLHWWRHDDADLWFNQCDGPAGRHRDIVLRPWDRDADHILISASPVNASGEPRLPPVRKRLAKLRGRYDAERLSHAIDAIGRDRDDMTMLVYEPSPAFSDAWFEVARERCRAVYAPDERATHPFVLPRTWSFPERAPALRAEPVPNESDDDRPLPLVCVTSGKSLWKGHDARLAFLRRLRAAGVPFDLYGRSLPADLKPRGPLQSKASVLRAARLTLAIENTDEGDRYVTEKLWDPLICWSLPLYVGPRAADRVAPEGSFVRVPDLADAGVDAIREALADPNLRRDRLDAIRAAREAALGPLRLVEWIAAVTPPNAHRNDASLHARP